jgi:hypothetical protein
VLERTAGKAAVQAMVFSDGSAACCKLGVRDKEHRHVPSRRFKFDDPGLGARADEGAARCALRGQCVRAALPYYFELHSLNAARR